MTSSESANNQNELFPSASTTSAKDEDLSLQGLFMNPHFVVARSLNQLSRLDRHSYKYPSQPRLTAKALPSRGQAHKS